jgi:formylglycine-generating enzyme required for sulfatase activity
MPHSQAQIRDLIHQHFDLEEFRDLCFRLGVSYDDLRGDNLPGRIRDLVLQLNRKHRLSDLLAFCTHLRPEVDWPDLSQPVALNAKPSPFAMPPRNPRQIFFSHAHQDADFAQRLATDLRRFGWKTWIAPDSIRPGEEWVDAINRGLAESGVFLLALTPDAVNSKWVYNETNAAIKMKVDGVIRFVPLAVKPAATPPLWPIYQAISFLNDYKTGLQQLLEELQPEEMTVVADLYRQLEQAMQQHDWAAAQTLAAQINERYPDYQQTNDLLTRARREAAHAQARQAEVDRLYPRLQTAIAAAEWPTALKLAQQIETQIPNYRDVAQLTQRARRAQRQGQRDVLNEWLNRIPVWGWGGGALLGLAALIVLFQLAGGGLDATAPDSNVPPLAAQLGDDWLRPVDKMPMVYVPPSYSLVELSRGDMTLLEAYWIDKHPITNTQYQLCVDAGVCSSSRFVNDSRFNGADHPVVGVSWFDARDYVEWLNETIANEAEWLYTLPDEAMWEYAAVGNTGWDYSWGDQFDGTLLNFCDINCTASWNNSEWNDGYRYTSPIGSYPNGASWVGVLDMAGNVWEWTDSWWDESETRRVVRGGSWGNSQLSARAASRYGFSPVNRSNDGGFRVVLVRRSPISS